MQITPELSGVEFVQPLLEKTMQDKERKQIIDRREMLRVKVKSLAEEARIIRREESRARSGPLREELHLHRVRNVRWAARDAHVAYGLIRGRTYEQIEPKVDEGSHPNWKEVERMWKQYGPKLDFPLGDRLKKAA